MHHVGDTIYHSECRHYEYSQSQYQYSVMRGSLPPRWSKGEGIIDRGDTSCGAAAQLVPTICHHFGFTNKGFVPYRVLVLSLIHI